MYSETGRKMAVCQPFDTVTTTGSSNNGCESRVFLRRRAILLSLARFLLVLLLGIIWSDQTFGSCGDYLHTRTSSPAVSMVHDAGQFPQGEKGEQRIPCSGPECRSMPQTPVIPPVVPGGVVRSYESAMADFGPLIELSSCQIAFVRISSARVTRGFPAQIDVPPECA